MTHKFFWLVIFSLLLKVEFAFAQQSKVIIGKWVIDSTTVESSQPDFPFDEPTTGHELDGLVWEFFGDSTFSVNDTVAGKYWINNVQDKSMLILNAAMRTEAEILTLDAYNLYMKWYVEPLIFYVHCVRKQ